MWEHLHSLLNSFLTLMALGAVCIILQKLFPSAPGQKLWRKESRLDLTYWLFITIFLGYITLFTAGILLTIIAVHFSPALLLRINSADSGSIKIYQVLLSIVLLDFIAYWVHRMFHGSHLWKYHSIHHSSKEIDWLSAVRFHPLETVIITTITYCICISCGFGFKEVALALTLRSFYGYLVHANVSWHFGPLGYIFASPYFHRWHHAKDKAALDKNFGGVFSLWDFIFRTAYFPKNLQPRNFGVMDDVGKNFWQQLLYPFRHSK